MGAGKSAEAAGGGASDGGRGGLMEVKEEDALVHESIKMISDPVELYFELSRKTGWEQYEVRRIDSFFKKTCADPEAGYNKAAFRDLFLKDVESGDAVSRVFAAMDQDQNKRVDLAELVVGVGRICCPQREPDSVFDFLLSAFLKFKKKKNKEQTWVPADLAPLAHVLGVALPSAGAANKNENGDGANDPKSSKKDKMTLEEVRAWLEGERAAVNAFRARFDVLPSRDDERSAVEEQLRTHSQLEVGDVWYVLSFRWWCVWKDFVQFDKNNAQRPTATADGRRKTRDDDDEKLPAFGGVKLTRSASGYLFRRPIAIDNSDIQGDDGGLKIDIAEGVDYTVVPEGVWRLLHGWYGGGPAYPRQVIVRAKGHKMIELYPFRLSFFECDKRGEPRYDTEVAVTLSSQTVLQDVQERCRKELGLQDTPVVRLWIKEDLGWRLLGANNDDKSDSRTSTDVASPDARSSSSATDELKMTLEDLDVGTGDQLIVEVPIKKKRGDVVVWPMDVHLAAVVGNWRDFKVGSQLDARDSMGKWYRASVQDLDGKRGKLLIHFEGWSDKWNEWMADSLVCTCAQQCRCKGRLAAPGSQSRYEAKTKRSGASGGWATNQRASNVEGRPVHKGVTGLFNLGNTCFMNSTLQCLSNTPIVTTFFSSGRYKQDINKKNPLGNSGKLATAFAHLVRDLWSGRYTAVAPREFRKVLIKAAPRFAGYQQHDSQELLAYLLDGLHEDLNRVIKKPPTDKVESEGRPDREVARLAWDTYLLRNRSIIVDVFTGLFKSKVVCPDASCGKVSVTFDPFMYVQLPLPSLHERRVPVHVVRDTPARVPPTTYVVTIEESASIDDLIHKLADMAGMNPDLVALCSIHKGAVYNMPRNEQSLSTISARDALYAYEETQDVVVDKDDETLFYVQVVHRYMKTWSDGERARSQKVAVPIVLTLSRRTTCARVHELIDAHVRMWLALAPPAATNNKSDDEEQQEEDEPSPLDSLKDDSYEVLITSADFADQCGVCSGDRCGGSGCPLSTSPDEPCRLTGRDTLTVMWEGDHDKCALISAYKRACRESSYARDVSVEKATSRVASVTLDDCLAKFTATETLGKQDAWYCSDCKVFRQATKKLSLWSTPEILIIQLKRFKQVNARRREKLTTFVDFPIRGLDLAPFLEERDDEDNEVAIYDLIAVSNHIGGGAGDGHYTAYAKNPQNSTWFSYDDAFTTELSADRLKTRNAFVLFYRKRH